MKKLLTITLLSITLGLLISCGKKEDKKASAPASSPAPVAPPVVIPPHIPAELLSVTTGPKTDSSNNQVDENGYTVGGIVETSVGNVEYTHNILCETYLIKYFRVPVILDLNDDSDPYADLEVVPATPWTNTALVNVQYNLLQNSETEFEVEVGIFVKDCGTDFVYNTQYSLISKTNNTVLMTVQPTFTMYVIE